MIKGWGLSCFLGKASIGRQHSVLNADLWNEYDLVLVFGRSSIRAQPCVYLSTERIRRECHESKTITVCRRSMNEVTESGRRNSTCWCLDPPLVSPLSLPFAAFHRGCKAITPQLTPSFRADAVSMERRRMDFVPSIQNYKTTMQPCFNVRHVSASERRKWPP
jgi:hypothetical protein